MDYKSYTGKILGSKRGFAFVKVLDDDTLPEFFIPIKKLNGAVHNDIVLIKQIHSPKISKGLNNEAEVIKIITRGNDTLVGVYYASRNFGIVQPDDDRFSFKIKVLNNQLKNSNILADSLDRVVVKLIWQKNNLLEPTGIIIENLGRCNNIESLQLGIIREHNLYETFPQNVVAECKNFNSPKNTDIFGRRDFRKEIIFTIDGEDAKDFDDAVSIKILSNQNFELGVHIADVGHYVKFRGAIDKEAFLRGTSVYFPNFVLPMLPEILSNDLCSLKEKTDKLTLSCIMEINNNGDVVNYEIIESVINSSYRLTYDEVYKVLMEDPDMLIRFKGIRNQLQTMNRLSKILETKRLKNGALDFEIGESYFDIDLITNEVLSVNYRERNDAHKLIENFMLIANETVAKYIYQLNLPFVYRVHEEPKKEKLLEVLDSLKIMGYKTPKLPKKLNSIFYDELLNLSNDEAKKQVINKLVLRSMQKARYSEVCLGHFGLALKYYCHFTSPIRRYADLTIHRIIKDNIQKRFNNKDFLSEMIKFVEESAIQSSITERNSDNAEREVDSLRACQYLSTKIGLEYNGIVTTIKEDCIYVQLDNSIEGFILLDRYYKYSKDMNINLSQNYKIGDKIKVKIVAVDLRKREIILEKTGNLK